MRRRTTAAGVAERVVLITGCSSGFGLDLARALAVRGWTVLAGLRDPSRAPEQLATMRQLPLDLADEAQIRAAATSITRLDCLINNAGFGLNGPFASYSAAQMRHQLQVNVLGPALLTQQLLPALAAARGRVISVSSVCGEVGLPLTSFYCASKYALEGLCESLYHELRDRAIQVALVEPGSFGTRFAANVVWGEQPLPPGSRDAQQLAAFHKLRAEMSRRAGNDPRAVVDAVLRLLEMRQMPLRMRVGREATAVRWLRRLLPESTMLRLVHALFQHRLRGLGND